MKIAALWRRTSYLRDWARRNFMPFKTIKMYIDYAYKLNSVENLAGNVLVFVPLGFLFPFVAKDGEYFFVMLLNAFVFVLGIEMFQLFSAFCFDVDDILLNCLGRVSRFWRVSSDAVFGVRRERGFYDGSLLKKFKTNVVVSSVLCVILGLVLVLRPGLSMRIVCTAVGVVLIVSASCG